MQHFWAEIKICINFSKVYKDYFAHSVNSSNLAGLVEQHIWRTEIPLSRDNYSTLGSLVKGNMLQAPVLNLVGIHAASAVIEGTVTFNGSLNPTKTSWIKIQVSIWTISTSISQMISFL